jgi:hypothetical protein
MIVYKLTDQDGWCRRGMCNETQYVPGWTYYADGLANNPLCSTSWIHAYEHPLLAVLHNPIHAKIPTPRMFRCRTGRVVKRDGQMKLGCRSLTVIEEVPVPSITTEMCVRYAIGCAWRGTSQQWRQWAVEWLTYRGHSEVVAAAAWAAVRETAREVVAAAAWAAVRETAREVVAAAAWSAARQAAWEAAWAAAREAAWAAAWAAVEGEETVNLIRVAEWAVTDAPIDTLYGVGVEVKS